MDLSIDKMKNVVGGDGYVVRKGDGCRCVCLCSCNRSVNDASNTQKNVDGLFSSNRG